MGQGLDQEGARGINPHHVGILQELNLQSRLDAGVNFGEETHIQLRISGRGELFPVKGISTVAELIELTSVASDNPRRVEFDRDLFQRITELARTIQEFQDGSLKFQVRMPLSDELTLQAGSDPGGKVSIQIFFGTKCYVIDGQGSNVVDYSNSDSLTFKFKDDIDQRMSKVTPPLSQLLECQNKTGDDLRLALPNLSAEFADIMSKLKQNFADLGINSVRDQRIESDVPDGEGGEIKLYLFPNENGELESIHLMRAVG